MPVRGEAADLEQIYLLNETGAEVWELLDGSRTAAEIGEELARRFDSPSPDTSADVVAFVEDLLGRRCVLEA